MPPYLACPGALWLLIALTAAVADEPPAWKQAGETAGEAIIGPDGGRYVWVPAGQFTMGADTGFGSEHKPAHAVRITRGFWLAACEVTNAQYATFCGLAGGTRPAGSTQAHNHPVVFVSWEDAVAYCGHYGMALPTEAQWEYAARGPESRRYPWGEKWDASVCCHYGSRGRGGWSQPVGSFSAGASWCGALDMAGNVYEWCADFYAPAYYRLSPTDDPSGPAEGERRAVRGGAWTSDDYHCRCATRSSDLPTQTVSYIGFRCVIVP